MARKAKVKKKRTVLVSLQLPEETFDLLRDVSLARHISGVASKVGGKEAKGSAATKLAMEGIALVVSDLVERHWDQLEDEAVKAGVKKRRKPVPASSSRRG